MKDKITFALIGVALAVLVIFIFNHQSSIKVPIVGVDGKISGDYAIEGIMKLSKPYICTFEKIDETSQIAGVIHTDGKNIYGEIRIKTASIEKQFNSFVLVKDNESYVWTSLPGLQNVGYKFPTAKSSSKNASPQNQAQIIGTQDLAPYECKPWDNPDNTIFDIPSGITFSELNK